MPVGPHRSPSLEATLHQHGDGTSDVPPALENSKSTRHGGPRLALGQRAAPPSPPRPAVWQAASRPSRGLTPGRPLAAQALPEQEERLTRLWTIGQLPEQDRRLTKRERSVSSTGSDGGRARIRDDRGQRRRDDVNGFTGPFPVEGMPLAHRHVLPSSCGANPFAHGDTRSEHRKEKQGIGALTWSGRWP